MKKHIFAGALIVLTVGCQPNSSNTMRSQTETLDIKNMGKQSSPQDASKSPTSKEAIIANLTTTAFDAAVRMQMDLAGTDDTSTETALLQKLFSTTGGPATVTVTTAFYKGKMVLHVELKDLDSTSDKDAQITAIALAYKDISRTYGFNQVDQETIYQAVLKRSALIAPSEAQKILIRTGTALFQNKATDLSRALIAGEDGKLLPAIKSLQEALKAFAAKDASYKLPANVARNTILAVEEFAKAQQSLEKDLLQGKAYLGSILPDMIDRLDFIQDCVGQYLAPRSKYNQPEMLRHLELGLLKETKEYRLSQGLTAEGMLEFKDLDCQVDGKAITFETTAASNDVSAATANLVINGQKPFFVRKIKLQRGISVGIVYKDFQVTYFKGLDLVSTEKGETALAVTLIPGNDASFEFNFKDKGASQDSKVFCSVKK